MQVRFQSVNVLNITVHFKTSSNICLLPTQFLSFQPSYSRTMSQDHTQYPAFLTFNFPIHWRLDFWYPRFVCIDNSHYLTDFIQVSALLHTQYSQPVVLPKEEQHLSAKGICLLPYSIAFGVLCQTFKYCFRADKCTVHVTRHVRTP